MLQTLLGDSAMLGHGGSLLLEAITFRIMIGIVLSLAPMSNYTVSRRISEISLGPISKRTTVHSPEFGIHFSAQQMSCH